MNARYSGPITLCMGLAGLTALSMPAHADVTVEQSVNLDAFAVKMDIDTVERISADKRRSDSETRCHGFLTLFCHDVKSGDIVRLDRQVEWQLEPKKKSYVEKPFPTPEERAQARQQMQAMLEQMKSCPQPAGANSPQSGPDTSKCELSKPTISVKRSDEHLTLLGHDTRKSSVILSQTCTDKETGDVCEIDYGFDSWLTTDPIPGAAERMAFEKKYLAAQGLDSNDPQFQGAMRQFMARYSDQLKELQARASSLKGYPLRTTFSMSFGGEHCGRAKEQTAQSETRGAGGRDLGLKNLASTAVGSKIARLFSRHGADGAVSSAAGNVGANATTAAADEASSTSSKRAETQAAAAPPTSAPNTLQVMSFTVETKSISAAPIPADQFDIPPGWKLQPQKVAKDHERELSCPAAGSS